jgi:hypothetical protein
MSDYRFVLCISNDGYPASLDVRRVYRAIPDADAETSGHVRVVDESGEDYLYPSEMFVPIEVPEPAAKVFNATAS